MLECTHQEAHEKHPLIDGFEVLCTRVLEEFLSGALQELLEGEKASKKGPSQMEGTETRGPFRANPRPTLSAEPK